MTRIRMDPQARQEELLEDAYVIAEIDGLRAVTRVAVANRTHTTPGLVNRYFGSRNGLREAVYHMAIRKKNAAIVADALQMDIFDDVHIPKNLLKAAHAIMTA